MLLYWYVPDLQAREVLLRNQLQQMWGKQLILVVLTPLLQQWYV